MKLTRTSCGLWLAALLPFVLTACFVEDPGPRQQTDRRFSVVDFDRLEVGSGLHIEVRQANYFAVTASGDRRNVEDLVVRKEGSTLVIEFDNFRERRYDTFIEIFLPSLDAVTFSGGSNSRVSGFAENDVLDVYLSGGSLCQLDVESHRFNAVLSGGSYLNVRGGSHLMVADVSGASALKAFAFEVSEAEINLSGASDAEVHVMQALKVTATGASHLAYRGNPMLSSNLSGASTIHQE